MIKMKMSYNYRVWVFASILFAWLSGSSLFIIIEFGEIEGEFGLMPNPYLGLLLKVHGLSAFIFLITFGFFVGTHVKATWRMQKNKRSGYTILGLQTFLIVSAYMLYYIADPITRPVLRYLHFAVGFALPFVTVIHVWHLISNRLGA